MSSLIKGQKWELIYVPVDGVEYGEKRKHSSSKKNERMRNMKRKRKERRARKGITKEIVEGVKKNKYSIGT